jgi:hypothetical protein
MNVSPEFTNELPFITVREPNRDYRLQGLYYCSSGMCCLENVHEQLPTKMGNCMSGSTISAIRRCLVSHCLENGFSGLLSRKRVLASRCLTMDYSSFQASCHIAPFLRLFFLDSLLVCHSSFFSKVSARDVY